MPVEIEVNSSDQSMKDQRKALAMRVRDYFGSCLLSSRKLLCFLDESDPPELRAKYGPDNRGFYGPIHGRFIRDSETLTDVPDYVTACIFPDDGVSDPPFPRVIDELIYLYGSTCADEVGLAIILAHELQHAIQHANVRKLWAVNGLVFNLDRNVFDALKLRWANIPTEREARIVSKRMAVHFFGEKRVLQYIDEKIAENVTEPDAADWRFVRTLQPSSTVDLDAETKQLFSRLRVHKAELEAILQEKKGASDPDFLDVDLKEYF